MWGWSRDFFTAALIREEHFIHAPLLSLHLMMIKTNRINGDHRNINTFESGSLKGEKEKLKNIIRRVERYLV